MNDTARLAPTETPLRAEPLRAGLQSLVFGRSGLMGVHNVRALLLTSGQASLQIDETAERLQGPSLLWAPWSPQGRLVVAPGSRGHHLVLGPSLLSVALRHSPHAAELGYMAERRYVVSLDEDDGDAATLQACFEGLAIETRQDRPMSASLVEAHLSILLVTLYRALKAGPHGMRAGFAGSPLGSRFIALIEAHLGERWPVAGFCDALGVSRDRLHSACLRDFGRPPGLIIRQRTMLEARRLLEQSTLSVDQIAQRLGFGSGSQFNHFFKGIEGIPPGTWRRRLRSSDRPRPPPTDLSAWP
ncbi:AraC family transcriptional regulator [Citreimonas salinaria]|uniref:Transcriptional regulator, AraC family n=1 Tax=Citreimonas salinaria TaxID=321339 RepID=A0A1H3LED5_9RHOB|nr:AraC family transcriptional regulator [Citreimonas salinaria]SDY62225.1 transcriptional regulator, AraC family [Citreimonas salinaria]